MAIVSPNSTTTSGGRESAISAINWGPVIAGAVAATILSIMLMILGAGLGLTIVSPWSTAGTVATTVAISAFIWLVVVQAISAGVGGYLTGRLRTRWTSVHNDEVYFRDTAHGFLSWALATLLAITVASSAISSIVSGGASAVGSVASGAATAAGGAAAVAANNGEMSNMDPNGYFLDTLFRAPETAAPNAATADPAQVRGEASRILARSAMNGEVAAGDRTYLAQMISRESGITQQEAEARIDQVVAETKQAAETAKQAADTARKGAITASLLIFATLLIGAFVASWAAAFGGRHRDEFEIKHPYNS